MSADHTSMNPNTTNPRDDFRRDQRRRGLLESSIVTRDVQLGCLEAWLAPQPLLGAETEDIQEFLDGRRGRDGGPITARTRYAWLSNLSAFYHWALRSGLVPEDPTAEIIRPRFQAGVPRPISERDLGAALSASDETMRTWLLLMAEAGLRCGEVAGLHDHDVTDDAMLRVLGKGARERLVPASEPVMEALRPFLGGSGPIFSADGARLNGSQVSRIVGTFLKGLGIRATAHQLRHRFGTQLYRATLDLRLVQELMGHSSPITTARYVAWSRSEAHEAVRRIAVVPAQQRLDLAAA